MHINTSNFEKLPEKVKIIANKYLSFYDSVENKTLLRKELLELGYWFYNGGSRIEKANQVHFDHYEQEKKYMDVLFNCILGKKLVDYDIKRKEFIFETGYKLIFYEGQGEQYGAIYLKDTLIAEINLDDLILS